MANTLAFFDQMNGVNYNTLSSTSFKLGIVDPDSAPLTSSQLGSLHAAGKTIIGYLSVGEAEDYRSYWQSSWDSQPPSFLLGENPDWAGNYNVKYWDPAWQQLVISQATAMAKAGYSGLMLDVVDAYSVSTVAAADGGIDHARADMVKFVGAISSATKAINPDFKIIQNNALDLLTTNPDDPSSGTNTAHLSHIDGVVAESTFYNPNNTATTWGSWNIQYLEHAVDAGKEVLAIDYPTSSSAQQNFITQAMHEGFTPFVGTQALNSIPSVNYQIPGQLPSDALAGLIGNDDGGTISTPPPSTVATRVKVTPYTGDHSYDANSGSNDYVFYKHTGDTTIAHFGDNDSLNIVSKIYGSAEQALSHVTYSHGNAELALDKGCSITLTGIADHSLTASDFHIFT